MLQSILIKYCFIGNTSMSLKPSGESSQHDVIADDTTGMGVIVAWSLH